MKKLVIGLGLLLFLAACSAPEPEIFDNGKPGQITVRIYNDQNKNHVWDEGEPGVVDQVSVGQGSYCPTGKPREERLIQTTGGDGLAVFSNLAAGRYCISYMGTKVSTTAVSGWAYLDSEEESEVHFGVLAD
jgi:hypothetical protein